jgi:GNAT superfamily N-acetyltransferase
MPKEIIIRAATRKDIKEMVLLLDDLFSIEADFHSDSKRQIAGITMLLDGCMKHKCIKVAEVDGKVVGMCSAQLLISTAQGTPAALVEDMVISENHRRKGIGRRLMQAIETWARSRGATRLQLLTDQTNAAAFNFYQRMGWRSTQLLCLRRMLS